MNLMQRGAAAFDAKSERERGLILAVVLTLVYLLWSLLVAAPMDAEQAKLAARQRELSGQQQVNDAEILRLQQASQRDPDQALKRQIAGLRADIDRLDQQLAELQLGLVPAQELAHILEAVLLQTGRLQLQKLVTLPVTELTFVAAAAESSQPATGVYRHAVAVTLQGGYAATLDYLRALEQLSWRFYWDSLHYRVLRYPQAEITLRVYTLSTERGAIGG